MAINLTYGVTDTTTANANSYGGNDPKPTVTNFTPPPPVVAPPPPSTNILVTPPVSTTTVDANVGGGSEPPKPPPPPVINEPTISVATIPPVTTEPKPEAPVINIPVPPTTGETTVKVNVDPPPEKPPVTKVPDDYPTTDKPKGEPPVTKIPDDYPTTDKPKGEPPKEPEPTPEEPKPTPATMPKKEPRYDGVVRGAEETAANANLANMLKVGNDENTKLRVTTGFGGSASIGKGKGDSATVTVSAAKQFTENTTGGGTLGFGVGRSASGDMGAVTTAVVGVNRNVNEKLSLGAEAGATYFSAAANNEAKTAINAGVTAAYKATEKVSIFGGVGGVHRIDGDGSRDNSLTGKVGAVYHGDKWDLTGSVQGTNRGATLQASASRMVYNTQTTAEDLKVHATNFVPNKVNIEEVVSFANINAKDNNKYGFDKFDMTKETRQNYAKQFDLFFQKGQLINGNSMIEDAMRTGSKVILYAKTDAYGYDAYNQRLSDSRVKNMTEVFIEVGKKHGYTEEQLRGVTKVLSDGERGTHELTQVKYNDDDVKAMRQKFTKELGSLKAADKHIQANITYVDRASGLALEVNPAHAKDAFLMSPEKAAEFKKAYDATGGSLTVDTQTQTYTKTVDKGMKAVQEEVGTITRNDFGITKVTTADGQVFKKGDDGFADMAKKMEELAKVEAQRNAEQAAPPVAKPEANKMSMN